MYAGSGRHRVEGRSWPKGIWLDQGNMWECCNQLDFRKLSIYDTSLQRARQNKNF